MRCLRKKASKVSVIYYCKYLLFPPSDAAVVLGEAAQPSQKEERVGERAQEARFNFTYTN